MTDVTTKLQGRAVDIVAAYQMILAITDTYKAERAGVENGFEKVYQQAVRMACQVGTQPSHPYSHQDTRQQHRTNTPAETSEQYYRRNCAVPFLDHIVSSLESRISPLAMKAASVLGLVPSVLCAERSHTNTQEAADMYSGDLSSPELVDMETTRWKVMFQLLPPEDHPDTLAKAMTELRLTTF